MYIILVSYCSTTVITKYLHYKQNNQLFQRSLMEPEREERKDGYHYLFSYNAYPS